MRQALRIGAVTVVAATGILSVPVTAASASSDDQGRASGSPGVLSGNSVQIPITIGANACGNSFDAVSGLNPATGNACGNAAPAGQKQEHEQEPEQEHERQRERQRSAPVAGDVREDAPETAVRARPEGERLAESGAGEELAAAAAGAGLLAGGAILYRRGRTGLVRR
ncbi:chaplin [Streptomyces sp. NPDC046939]|uniref:chaplin n=1 Tax=Streptomyces sp. NPDC046939 TaxID=3155376 RepID=UPI0033C96C4D